MGKPNQCFSDFYVCVSHCEESKLQKLRVLTIPRLIFLKKEIYLIHC